jgi:hypothetical protein
VFTEFTLDPSQQVTVATGPADATLTVPVDSNLDAVNNPNNVGSFWFLCVDGAAVAINFNAPAVYGSQATLQQGSYLTHPLRLAPGSVLHFVTSGGTGTVSIIRARRAS